MACQKVCKQGRDDIIAKVNLQSPIPTSFYIAVTNQCQNDAGMWLCKFTFTIISSLPCLHTFWHAIPTSFYIFNVFKSFAICVSVALHKVSQKKKRQRMRSTKSADLIGPDKFLSWRQLDGRSVTRPFLSLRKVWLARLG